MSDRSDVVVRYVPQPPELGASLAWGARVVLEGLGNGPVTGRVVPGERSELHERLGPDWFDALDRAAREGAAGHSGAFSVDLADFLPW